VPTPKRTFTYDEACSLMPEVRRLTDLAFQRFQALGHHGPIVVESPAGQIVQQWAQDVSALGAEVKGLWLVDFDNGSGYYCWQHPEAGLHHYHSYDVGFQGRMRIQ
jgi:hypothetical protein